MVPREMPSIGRLRTNILNIKIKMPVSKTPRPLGECSIRLLRFLADRVAPGGRKGRLSILIFHRVLISPDPMRPDEVDASRFHAQMRSLSGVFNILPLSEAIQRSKREALPRRALAITFDDGYADNHAAALPILKRYQLPATFFIATGYLDGGIMWNDAIVECLRNAPGSRHDFSGFGLGCHTLNTWQDRRRAAEALIGKLKYLPTADRESSVAQLVERFGFPPDNHLMMTADQVVDLVSAGMEIGAHTITHPILSSLESKHSEKEIIEGRSQLQDISGRPVPVFAYPNGKPGLDYRREHVAMARRAGFIGAVSTAWGSATPNSDPFQLPRFTPWDRNLFRFILRQLFNYTQGPQSIT